MTAGVVLNPASASLGSDAGNAVDDVIEQARGAYAELAAVGSAEAVVRQLRSYLDAGATDLVLSPLRSQTTAPQALWEVAAAL